MRRWESLRGARSHARDSSEPSRDVTCGGDSYSCYTPRATTAPLDAEAERMIHEIEIECPLLLVQPRFYPMHSQKSTAKLFSLQRNSKVRCGSTPRVEVKRTVKLQ